MICGSERLAPEEYLGFCEFLTGRGLTFPVNSQHEAVPRIGAALTSDASGAGWPTRMSAQIKEKANDKSFVQMESIINSMTPGERARPDVIKGGRKRRIAAGSGTQIQDVNRLLKQFTQMQKMMKKMSGGGMKKMMRNMKGMMPPGGPGGMGGMFPPR